MLSLAVAAILLACGNARAQTAGEFASSDARSAYGEWRKLSQSEVNCADRMLRRQGSTLWTLIQRGVRPSSTAVAKLRSVCKPQTTVETRPANSQAASQALATTRDVVTTTTTVVSANKSAATPDVTPKPAASRSDAGNAAVAPQALADRAAANQAAIEKIAAEKAAERAAAEKAAAEKMEAERAAAAAAAAEQAAAEKAAAAKAAADQAATRVAQADVAEAPGEADHGSAGEQTPQSPFYVRFARAVPDLSAPEARIGILYGLASGPVLFILGGIVFLFMQRRRRAVDASPGRSSEGDFDRLVTAVIMEIDRRELGTSDARRLLQAARSAEAPLH